jgi:DNA repair protein RadC
MSIRDWPDDERPREKLLMRDAAKARSTSVAVCWPTQAA